MCAGAFATSRSARRILLLQNSTSCKNKAHRLYLEQTTVLRNLKFVELGQFFQECLCLEISVYFEIKRLSAISFGDSLDWKELSAAEITQRVTSKVQPGSIVLFHNAALHTPEALPGIIEALLRDGYSFVPISQIILTGEYTIDHTGRQCPAG